MVKPVGELSATKWTVVQAAQAGDEPSVRALFDKYRPAVVAYLKRRGLGDEAEDVAQEVFLSLLHETLQSADPCKGSFRGLVFAITRNLLVKHLARQQAQKRGGGKVQPLGEVDPAGPERDPDFDREWLRSLLQQALDRLEQEHANYHQAMRLFMLEGRPQREIATELGVSEGTIKKHVHRGRKKLAAYMQVLVWRYSCSAKDFATELRYLSRLLTEGSGGSTD